ncbi:MAG: ABC transporter ATP-binding protein [Bacteroides sp.]|nr:ABC transporter ATP-binding protein [Eubacterium sp.]MCM1417432.1 ABC transporter ATP-binding protein [Roseburia sp.]MCM1461612.1 ABC transporter ATP-binding protein [Bacteroides sp.]
MIEISETSMIFHKKGIGKADEREDFKALDNITLTIPDGCIYGFLGSNGAGKSTLLRMICGIYKTERGSVRIDGEDVFNNPAAKAKVFFVNDETIQYAGFTLDGLARYYASYYDTFSRETYERLVAKIGLPRNKRMSDFSKGMKRQAVVVIGLSCYTKYLLLDEAFDGLDPAMRRFIKQIIVGELVDREATLVVSSHNITEINELCDRAILIHRGQMIFADEIDKIKSGFGKLQLGRSGGAVTPEELKDAGLDVVQYSADGSVARAVIRGSEEEINARSAAFGCEIRELIPLTLEEIFIYELEARGYGSDIL